jgi:hypothetical protein
MTPTTRVYASWPMDFNRPDRRVEPNHQYRKEGKPVMNQGHTIKEDSEVTTSAVPKVNADMRAVGGSDVVGVSEPVRVAAWPDQQRGEGAHGSDRPLIRRQMTAHPAADT